MQAIEEIKERIDIVEFISGYVSLKKAGRTYKGLCPFHAEKTSSFVVFPHTQTWHCFGACGTGGDIFSFLMRREGLDFSEALRQLAERAGVLLEPLTPRSEVADQRRTRLLEMHVAAAQYYHNLLRNSPEGATACGYLSKRAISQDAVDRFQLGYAPNSWENLKAFLVSRGYGEEELVEGGLLVQRESGQGSYDRFRNRLVIPIRDAKGQVIAFGARALDPNDVPKYLNSPQTPLFDKGGTLFGIDLARSAIREADQAVIVEGYMDVISAHQCGYANVVAGMGTALTETQMRQVKRLSGHLVLALDADTAGVAATLRGIGTAREALGRSMEPVVTSQGLVRFEERLDVDIRIATLPAGRDPDDVLRESPQQWPEIISQAQPVVSFTMSSLASQLDLTTARGKSELVRQVVPMLKEVGNVVERTHYVGQLAQMVKVDERVVLAELERPTAQQRRTTAASDQPAEPAAEEMRTFGQEEHLLALIMLEPQALATAHVELADLGFEGLSAEDFERGENRSLFPLIAAQAAKAATAEQMEQAVAAADPLLRKHAIFVRERGVVPTAIPARLAAQEVVTRVLRLRIAHVQGRISSLRFLLSEAVESGSDAELRSYQKLVDMARESLRALERACDQRSLAGRRRGEAIREGIALR